MDTLTSEVTEPYASPFPLAVPDPETICLLGVDVTGEDIRNEGASTWMVEDGPFLVVIKFFGGVYILELTVCGTVAQLEKSEFATATAAALFLKDEVDRMLHLFGSLSNKAAAWAWRK
jgi:hypothetical protein